ncbi:TetR family transcriptional regulator [Bradyrhizobium oligotrophicum S58]|uniref:TetR family transcriptional regulator n=2 Tax=Bradyrhizobium oligotrophicum TaxID=44255 RepID=M4ZXR1_9BRAD|nr:TetR family transcriptional regulator [Bradyrhizobium oligotrophicum S58]
MVTSSSHAAPSTSVAGPGRTERKHAQILASARTLFMAGGFDTTSVDAIARHAGVSKATLYGHFADKDALLLALVEADCRSMGETLWIRDERPIDLERDLREIARRFLAMFLDGRGLAMHRLVMSCASRYPAIAEAFMTAGPDRCDAEVAAFLRAAEVQGLLDVPDARLAATQFLTLIQGRLPLTWALSMKAPSPAVSRAQIEGGIKVFIAAYGRTEARSRRPARAISTSASRRPRASAAKRP